MSDDITLPARLDYPALPALRTRLTGAAAAEGLRLNAAEVEHLGTAALQLLLALARDRAAAGLPTPLAASPALRDQLAAYGIAEGMFTIEEATT